MQGSDLTKCCLEITILLADAAADYTSSIEAIATLSDWLDSQHVSVCLSIQFAPKQQQAPAPAVLQALAKFLQQLDCFPVPQTSAAPDVDMIYAIRRVFKPVHIAALAQAALLTSLCICDTTATVANQGFIQPIACMRQLTRLHLSFFGMDFAPLGQLQCLEDLALQCSRESACCQGVIQSSSHTLRHIVLASYSWSQHTYEALCNVPNLATLFARVNTLNLTTAKILANLLAPDLVELALRRCQIMEPAVLRKLTSGRAKVQKLTVWHIDDRRCSEIQSMSTLLSLAVLRSASFSGRTLQPQPSLTSVTLVDCSALSSVGLECIIEGFPSLRSIAFLPQSEHVGPQDYECLPLQLPQAALAHGRGLTQIDLRGVCGVSAAAIQELEVCFGQQQALRRAQPQVTVQWLAYQQSQSNLTIVIDVP